MKKFKTESKRVLDMVINSIYTNKEIFVRELLSNCSDAIDKLYFKSLQDGISGLSRDDFSIDVAIDKDARIIKISDNGIGMTSDEMDKNLGTIAKSGSADFKEGLETDEDINIIGQFGVGFYSAFMVADKVEVVSCGYGTEEANIWTSNGVDGYTIASAEKSTNGTEIIIHIKDDTEQEKYGDYLEEYKIKELIRKYSNYIRYPIKMATTKTEMVDEKEETHIEIETVNDMVPLWKKQKSDITAEEYETFYKDMFYDMEAPVKTIHTSAEGAVDYKALLFIPSKAPYDYYTKAYEKGLKLYTNGVMVMEKCSDLLPDFFSFVRGLVDTELTLNVSRETVQQNRTLKIIANNLQKKIKNELMATLLNDREGYEKFFAAFGVQLKHGIYSSWGMNNEWLQDLLIFRSVKDDKMITLTEYVETMLDSQKFIYYASAKTIESIKSMPQSERLLEMGYDILCASEDLDEFTFKTLMKFKDKEFRSIASEDIGLDNDDVTAEEDVQIAEWIKETLAGEVEKVKISHRLKSHAVCLTSEGEVSLEMEKVINGMPNMGQEVVAKKILEINADHDIYVKIKSLYESDQEKLKVLAEVLLGQARLMQGLPVDDMVELSKKIVSLLV
ncbi:MAG: molecular chaperone HtpG [Bacillota bacterium]